MNTQLPNSTNMNNFFNTILENGFLGYVDFIQKSEWNALSDYLYLPQIKLNVENITHLKFNLTVVDILVSCIPFVFIFGLLVVYLSVSGLKLISFGGNSTNIFTDVFTNLTDIDDELGAFDDAVFYFVVFTLIIA